MNDIDLILCHVVSQTGFSTIQCTYNMHNVYIYIHMYTYISIYYIHILGAISVYLILTV